jgi:hypothetical protein
MPKAGEEKKKTEAPGMETIPSMPVKTIVQPANPASWSAPRHIELTPSPY